MWKNIVESNRPQMTIWRMRIAWWIANATNTHTHTHTCYTIGHLMLFHCKIGCTNEPHFYLYVYCLSCCNLTFLSQYLTKLIHKICFIISFISCLYMFRAHVLIIMRSKLHYTASAIITSIGGRLVHELCCVMQCWPHDDEHLCSKHVEAWNRTYCETNFVHQVG